ncbi:MAG: TfoX/Sxy family protein [Steroidobacteraceae bacterium]
MAITDEFSLYVLEQLGALGAVAPRRMFGAVGLYCDGVFFGLIAGDVLYFKVGESNRGDYAARGMSRFRPYRDRPHLSMNYYEVPADVLEEPEECVLWARRSLNIVKSPPKARARASNKLRSCARVRKHS